MPKMHVKKTTSIDCDVDTVFPLLANLEHWQEWSPWTVMEPDASVTVQPDGKSYSWDGKRIGSGSMTVTDEKFPDYVNYDLRFLTPYKSEAKVRFELLPRKSATEVVWTMESALPFFMFWMRGTMETLIGMDFQRGLTMLKEYAETGEVYSRMEFIGPTTCPGCQYIGINTECSLDAIGEQNQIAMQRIGNFMEDKMEQIDGQAISIYHKFQPQKNYVNFTAAVPVITVPDQLPDDFTSGVLPDLQVYRLRHIGAYHHLGNAWATLQNLQQSKVFRHNKARPPFESYVNSPANTEARDLITDINYPV